MSEAQHQFGSTRHDCQPSGKSNNHETHSHSHGHDHFQISDPKNVGFKLKVSTLITILLVIAGVIGGIYSGSLALLSDAAHNFTDALALILALIAIWLQARPASMTKTYGYHRAGILAAFINSSTLILIVAGICYEAIHRILHPQPVSTVLVSWIALLGLIVNGGITWALHRESKSDITIRSAYIHMLGDAAGTVGILIGSIIMYYTDYWIIDPIISLALSLLILWTSWDILHETVNLLLEGTPRGIDVDSVSDAIQAIPGVRALHHLHIWGIASRMTALSCHLQVEDMNLSHCQQILLDVNTMLKEQFRIDHATLQVETACAEDNIIACQPRLQDR